MSERGPKRSDKPPSDPNAAAAFGQDLLTQLQHDIGAKRQREADQKAAAANLANALLGKIATDFGLVPPPPMPSAPPPATVSSAPPVAVAAYPSGPPVAYASTMPAPPPTPVVPEEELQAAQQGPLSAEELADLDAMTAPTGFWGKLVSRLRGKREG